ncbi:glucan endo-1,3-beta-glucosidase-like protein 2 [Pyrus ussuriensis x Pyrus communis]|uniref:Glucan endo-1,3-beta-glucosidase-like protein 2 n=1 Tax=Pyrus ussuriensis x Pyrus communis TaxID=2448454 RepID=A0A5N5I395_9ROSA|nr:glucan endo-1,3-beta-glucosidase-like protein 2 [Pyrus ussuriensis x Pyrus communis]
MAALAFAALLLLAMAGQSSANWCVCKDGDPTALQRALDYACGAGADCNPIKPNGVCYNPNTVKAHCSYAVNSYFQKKGQSTGTCDFSGTATPTATDPTHQVLLRQHHPREPAQPQPQALPHTPALPQPPAQPRPPAQPLPPGQLLPPGQPLSPGQPLPPAQPPQLAQHLQAPPRTQRLLEY